jgi:hypothetical protein
MDSNESNLEKESVDKNMKVGLFLTDRSLYGKVRLSRTMVFDHFMPTYKRAMENLIEQLERELCETSSLEQVNEETPLLERACNKGKNPLVAPFCGFDQRDIS